ncbi:MAG: hypothetical protein FWD42_10020, partial [Solirubrobacterales bacterium]|nr:hypothetical protein [Solirubrobacterales bacterium]
HPFAFTTLIAANVASVNGEELGSNCDPPRALGQSGCAELVGTSKDIEVKLPRGFVGNPLAVPRCSQEQFEAGGNAGCPASTQVGSAYVAFFGSANPEQYAPIYNVEPSPGHPAEFGLTVGGGAHIPIFFKVRSEGDYGITADVSEISTFDAPRLISMMIWGVPVAEAHNPMRESIFGKCQAGAKEGALGCSSDALPAKPLLTLPSSCSGEPLGVPFTTDAWQSPGQEVSGEPLATLPALTGCETLPFSPEIGLHLTTAAAGAPAGYTVNLGVPQSDQSNSLGTADVRDVEVALPAGTQISPSAANGLAACSDEEFALHGGSEAKCPAASVVGTVKVSTPLLAQPLTGEAFVGQPECGPCTASQARAGQLVRLFIQVQGSGVLVKLAGNTKIDTATGQLTTVFTDNPQLPFEELELRLEDGPRAPLTNPSACGPAVAVAKLTPWSSLTSQSVAATGPPTIEGCSAPSFTPGLVAGMNGSARGGSFGSFEVALSRPDGQQDLGAVTLHTAPGLAAILANVPLCGEAQANAGSCDAASQIGEASASVGSGSEPYTVHGGKLFLTGPYDGGSFGLSIVVPAQAGPYRLAGVNGAGGEGDGSVVIRGSIEVDPHTAAITITTNPIPTQLDGIPLHLQRVIVNVNREGFMFNPTSCATMSVEGTIASSTGTTAPSSYPFQSTDCANLGFKPKFNVSTSAKTSRTNGASLGVKLAYPNAPQGTQANIKSVHVELPKALPSRLSTLNHACLDSVFNQNPAGCPSQSRVGSAKAITPVLPVPLEGPAYFVSHGGQQFPELIMVLQGYGVTVDLAGETFISKAGVTSTTFPAVPDVPVSSFELTLPEGPYSALDANGDLCAQKLVMPTTFTAQSGAVVKQQTQISVQGCKPAIRVLRHSVRGKHATVVVSVPSAGRLIADGGGVLRSARMIGKAGTVTLTLELSRSEQRFVAGHRGRRLKVPIRLSFTPARGQSLQARVAVLMR